MATGLLVTGQVQFARLSKTLSGNVTLSEAEQTCQIMEFEGSYVGSLTVTLYAVQDGAIWLVFNNACSGDLTIKASGGTGVAIANGKRAIVYCDDTDVYRVTADT